MKTFLPTIFPAIGIDTHLEIDYRATGVQEGDQYLFTTDGVHDFVSDQEIVYMLKKAATPQQAAEQ